MEQARVIYVAYADERHMQRQFAYISSANVDATIEDNEVLSLLTVHVKMYENVNAAIKDAKTFCRTVDMRILLEDNEWHNVYAA